MEAQRNYGGKLGTNLVELGFISELDLAKFLGKQLNMPPCSPLEFDEIRPSALAIIPADFASKHNVMPLSLGDKIRIAISDPYALQALDELKFKLGKPIEAVIAPEIWIIAGT